MYRPSAAMNRREEIIFLARVEWLPVTSRSHGRHITDVTDKCKISIMIVRPLGCGRYYR